MPQQKFEDYSLTDGSASEKRAGRLKVQTDAALAQAQQQHEDKQTTQEIEAGELTKKATEPTRPETETQ